MSSDFDPNVESVVRECIEEIKKFPGAQVIYNPAILDLLLKEDKSELLKLLGFDENRSV